jgi:hypothetical protein
MIELAAPGWLAGLILVPLIRLLHQLQGRGPVQVVPAAFLWPDGPARDETGVRLAPPDPAWRRRAAAAALLVLTLTAPSWPTGLPPPIEVLIDNRPSLLTREADGSRRTDQAARAIQQAIGSRQAPSVRLRPVAGNQPEQVVDAADGAATTRALERLVEQVPVPDAAALPAAGLAGTRRWLVTDGSGDTEGLAALGPFERVLAVGVTTENQGIIRLAARPALDRPGSLEVLVTLTNAGQRPASRGLSLTGGGRTLAGTTLEVPAGTTVRHTWQVPWDGSEAGAPRLMVATLAPPDALESDDRIELALDALAPAPIHVAGTCGAAVAAALAAHPGIRLAAAQDPADAAALRVWCRPEPPPADAVPTLWLPPGMAAPSSAEPARWLVRDARTPAVGRLGMRVPAVRPDGRVLLAAGQDPLIIEQPEARRLIGLFDTGLDRDPGAGNDTDDLPLLLDWMLARLIGHDLLYPAVAAARPAAAVRVAPGPVPAAAPLDLVASGRPAVPLWTLPLIGAIVLLALDLRRGAAVRTRARWVWPRPGQSAAAGGPSVG